SKWRGLYNPQAEEADSQSLRRVDKTDEMDEESSHKTGETQRMAMPRIESTRPAAMNTMFIS
ncbi:MAG: hypothetical protein WA921_01185, partial [Ahrensia sp.]